MILILFLYSILCFLICLLTYKPLQYKGENYGHAWSCMVMHGFNASHIVHVEVKVLKKIIYFHYV